MNIKTAITKEKMTAAAEHPNSQEQAFTGVINALYTLRLPVVGVTRLPIQSQGGEPLDKTSV